MRSQDVGVHHLDKMPFPCTVQEWVYAAFCSGGAAPLLHPLRNALYKSVWRDPEYGHTSVCRS